MDEAREKPMTHRNESPEFDRYASSYDELLDDPLRRQFTGDPNHFHLRKWILIERLLKRAGVSPGSLRWLDVGCGRGELLELAGNHFAQAMGCDPSAGMLSSSGAFTRHEQKSLVELPFDDGSVDFVTAVCVFHHVHGADRRSLMGEIRRVLSRGGLFCIIEHNPWNPVVQAIVKRCPVDADAELLTAGEATKLISNGGLSPVSRDYFLYLPEGLFRLLGGMEPALSAVPLGGQYAVLARSS